MYFSETFEKSWKTEFRGQSPLSQMKSAQFEFSLSAFQSSAVPKDRAALRTAGPTGKPCSETHSLTKQKTQPKNCGKIVAFVWSSHWKIFSRACQNAPFRWVCVYISLLFDINERIFTKTFPSNFWSIFWGRVFQIQVDSIFGVTKFSVSKIWFWSNLVGFFSAKQKIMCFRMWIVSSQKEN